MSLEYGISGENRQEEIEQDRELVEVWQEKGGSASREAGRVFG